MAPKLGFEYDDEAVDYLIDKHYRAVEPAVPLLPAARPAVADPQLLPVLRRAAADDRPRALRLRGRELLRGDVSVSRLHRARLQQAACGTPRSPVRPFHAEVELAAADRSRSPGFSSLNSRLG